MEQQQQTTIATEKFPPTFTLSYILHCIPHHYGRVLLFFLADLLRLPFPHVFIVRPTRTYISPPFDIYPTIEDSLVSVRMCVHSTSYELSFLATEAIHLGLVRFCLRLEQHLLRRLTHSGMEDAVEHKLFS